MLVLGGGVEVDTVGVELKWIPDEEMGDVRGQQRVDPALSQGCVVLLSGETEILRTAEVRLKGSPH